MGSDVLAIFYVITIEIGKGKRFGHNNTSEKSIVNRNPTVIKLNKYESSIVFIRK